MSLQRARTQVSKSNIPQHRSAHSLLHTRVSNSWWWARVTEEKSYSRAVNNINNNNEHKYIVTGNPSSRIHIRQYEREKHIFILCIMIIQHHIQYAIVHKYKRLMKPKDWTRTRNKCSGAGRPSRNGATAAAQERSTK